MYYSRQFTTLSTQVPTEMNNILKDINDQAGTIVSVTQSATDVEGIIKITAIIIYSA